MAGKKGAETVQDFETSLRQLEGIVEKLEQGDIPLEKALAMYEQGIQLARSCGELLNTAEVRLKRLGRDLEGNLKLFDQQEDTEE
jgi:exodeoxyribonuclease VII small subunit